MTYQHDFLHAVLPSTAAHPLLQHIVDTYASETNKTASTWVQFSDDDLDFKPHIKSSSVREIIKHQLLSERRFFSEFLGSTEPAPATILPEQQTVSAFCDRFVQLAAQRLSWLASLGEDDWTELRPFFDESRSRIWIFWRRVLHSAHHRTQLTVYLRLLNKAVPSTYGPTADVTWEGADPTTTIEAASRQNRAQV